MRGLALLVLLAMVAAGCGVFNGDQEGVLAVWDLRETRSIEAVEWPGDRGSSFEATTGQGLERILLPGGVVVDGEFRANPSRDGGIEDDPFEDELRALSVTFERESVEEVMERARAYAERLGGVGLERLDGWAAGNADSQDVRPGGAKALSGRTTLGRRGPSAQLQTQAFPNEEAVLRLLVFWPVEDE